MAEDHFQVFSGPTAQAKGPAHAAKPGTCPLAGATCGQCRHLRQNRIRGVGVRGFNCAPAVSAARDAGLKPTFGAVRRGDRACSHFKAKGGRR